jgi:CheY-like chemotaxis protein
MNPEQNLQTRRLADEYPLSILIAEDNLINQKLLVKILESLGYTADAVTNGEEVIESVKNKQYDLILMDIQMPEMDGVRATEILRQDEKNNSIRIIAVTAYAMYGDRERYIAAGMNHYISKPFRIDELMEGIVKVAKAM